MKKRNIRDFYGSLKPLGHSALSVYDSLRGNCEVNKASRSFICVGYKKGLQIYAKFHWFP